MSISLYAPAYADTQTGAASPCPAQALNVTHRDIKPENLMVRLQQTSSQQASATSTSGNQGGISRGGSKGDGRGKLSPAGSFNASQLDKLHVTIIDMGSAVSGWLFVSHCV
jgi:serine/threonine protein kinase